MGSDEAFPRDLACQQPPVLVPKTIDEAEVIGFCGFLTAELPELHKIHPQRVLDAWERYKAARAEGFAGVFADEHESGDGA